MIQIYQYKMGCSNVPKHFPRFYGPGLVRFKTAEIVCSFAPLVDENPLFFPLPVLPPGIQTGPVLREIGDFFF